MFQKFCESELTVSATPLFSKSRQKRGSQSESGRSGLLDIRGLQIGTQFCPGMMNGNVIHRRKTELGFFVALNIAGRWFFDIYIQGSKNNF